MSGQIDRSIIETAPAACPPSERETAHASGRRAACRYRRHFAGDRLAGSPPPAQTGADFYKGKTVTYIVATAPGGGYDLYGRLVAEYMQKYLPGSTFVVKNMPGAGHLIGTNTIYASKPDGLTIGTFNTGLIYNQLIGLDGVKFDLNKMSWIGKAASDPRVFTMQPAICRSRPSRICRTARGAAQLLDRRRRQRGLCRNRDAHQGAQAAGQDPHRLQRHRRSDGDAPRRSYRHRSPRAPPGSSS